MHPDSTTNESASASSASLAVGSVQAPETTAAFTGSSHMLPSLPPPHSRATLPISIALSKDVSEFSLALHHNDKFLVAFLLFESVRLEAISFTVALPPGSGVRGFYCACASKTPPTGHYLAQPLAGFIGGGHYGTTKETFALPSNHSFGRELKASNIGNAPPVFHFKIEGLADTPCYIRGEVTVSFSGHGLLHALV